MNVNEQIWGESFWEIGTNTINCRNNVTDKTDIDYEDYPPFISNKVPDVADSDYPCSLFQFVENDLMELNTEIDKSICYVGFEGGALSDITAWIYDDWHNGEPWLYTDYTDNKTTYMLVDGFMDKSIATPSMGTTSGTVWQSTYTSPQLGLYNRYINWSPDAITGGDLTSTANQKLINRNLRLSPYRSWGLRTIYLVINVAYLTNSPTDGGSTNPTLSKTTLHSYYADHNDTWRESHPRLGAWAIPYTRISKSGGYSNTQTSGSAYNRGNHTTSVSIVSELHDGGGIRYDYRFATNYNTTMGYFPLFGYVGLGHPDVTSIPATSGSAACPLYMGIRTAPNIVKKASTNKVCWVELDGNAEGTYEYLMSCCAYYGLFFADGTYSLANTGQDETRWTDTNMCLPIISEQGYTDGSYTRGAYNVTNPAFEWKDTTRSPYVPDRPPTPENIYSDTTVFNSIGDLATMFKRYVISASEVETLGKDLFKITDDLAVGSPSYDEYATKVNSQFLVSNPLDCIISLRRFPMEIPKDGNYDNIMLGTNEINTSGYGMEKTAYTYLFEMATPIYPNFGDSFLDYEPYTTYELYVPFCGTVKLNPRDIIGRKLAVQMVVDFTTGTATGFVMSGNLVIETVNGNIAIDIPVTGINAATIASQLNNAIAQESTSYNNKYTAGFDLAKSMINPLSWGGGSIVGKFGSALNAETSHQLADYNLHHQDATPHSIGAASPVGLWAIDLNCRLICYFPTGDVITVQNNTPKLNNKIYEYGANTGFATIETNTIGSYTGLVVATNPLLGSITTERGKALTDDEIQGIISDLAEGVII